MVKMIRRRSLRVALLLVVLGGAAPAQPVHASDDMIGMMVRMMLTMMRMWNAFDAADSMSGSVGGAMPACPCPVFREQV